MYTRSSVTMYKLWKPKVCVDFELIAYCYSLLTMFGFMCCYIPKSFELIQQEMYQYLCC